MHRFTACDTALIHKNDFYTFEAVFANMEGEVWHACYEVAQDGKITAFEALQQIAGVEADLVGDLAIVRRREHVSVFCAADGKVWQWAGSSTLRATLANRPKALEFEARVISIHLSYSAEGEPFGVGILLADKFAFCKLSDQPISMGQLMFVDHNSAIGCVLWQFHSCFLFSSYLQVASLITGEVVHTKHFDNDLSMHGIDFSDQTLLVYAKKAPILVAKVENESRGVWRLFEGKGMLREALAHCDDSRGAQHLATLLAQ